MTATGVRKTARAIAVDLTLDRPVRVYLEPLMAEPLKWLPSRTKTDHIATITSWEFITSGSGRRLGYEFKTTLGPVALVRSHVKFLLAD